MIEQNKFTTTQWVLGRNFKDENWRLDIFSHYDNDSEHSYQCTGAGYFQCIPYEGNEYLCGKVGEPEKKYILKDGDFVVNTYSQDGNAFIYREDSSYENSLSCYCGLYAGDPRLYIPLNDKGRGWSSTPVRLATEEEKQLLLDALYQMGKDWDAKNKKL